MNGLTLRVGSKITNRMPTAVLEAVTISTSDNCIEKTSIWYEKFTVADSADLQINILKEASLKLKNEDFTFSLIEFLVAVYVEAPLKHPVKCYVAKLILKNYKFKDLFQMALTDALKRITIKNMNEMCGDAFVKAVGVINGCTDNFPVGVSAIMDCKQDVLVYLAEALNFFVNALRHSDNISPTEKTTLCTHIHNTARTLLNILHNANEKDPDVERMINLAFSSVARQLDYLLLHPDVPMDTKTLSSILSLTIMQLLHGNEIWKDVLVQSAESKQDGLSGYIHLDQGVILSKYAAILIVVPREALANQIMENKNVLIILCDGVLEICERSSSEPTIVLSVARTILRLTNILEVIKLPSVVIELAEKILLFVWSHIEFYMDSVRHLSIQIFSNIVKICGILSKKGIKEPLENVFSSVLSLPLNRKGYYVGLNGLALEIGTLKLLQKDPELIIKVLSSLDNEAIGANVSTLLETLLDKHMGECGTEEIYEEWIKPIIRVLSDAESAKTTVYQATIQKLIGKAVKVDSGIIEYIRSYIDSSSSTDTKYVLIFLSALRKAGALQSNCCSHEKWKGIIHHDVLRNCLVHPSEEIRTLAISLLAETQKTTELFTETELQLCLWFWEYNINTQSPGFRQLSVTIMKKILRRWESSYYVIERDGIEAILRQSYLDFIHKLRKFCFSCLFPGANLSRRIGALQIIVLIENLNIQSVTKSWTQDYIDRLLLHLEDTYEINKKLALDILFLCPEKYFLSKEPFTTSIGFKEVLQQARSIKPTDCISAAYKLNLLLVKNCISANEICVQEGVTLPKAYFIVKTLMTHLKLELAIAKQNLLLAASSGPMYGLVYCVRHILQIVDPGIVASDNEWSELLSDIIETAFEVNESVSPVVNSESPEGHLPNDKGLVRSGFNETGELYLSDGSKVTSQMVLLCAWRSVKEVSLLLGDITSKFHIAKDHHLESVGNLMFGQILRIGQHFTLLLAETKHRGAFEQAYVGFTQLCARLWQCKSTELHILPQRWLNEQMEAICLADSESKMCATRRSAGVPFMIQALVTTELQVDGNAKCFNRCMSKLFEIACFDSKRRNDNASIESRIHSLNILKALFKHTALGEIVNPYVSDGLITAIQGFEAGTWAERNSSTLLFSSLMVRIFGVQRTKDIDKLCIRNKMTGRIFFLRYPKMYNFLLEKLEMLTVRCDQNNINQLQPSLYPILLILSRLYPSSLEGTVSNLKLVAFIPYVMACAKSCVLKIRQLAGRAIVSLISHERYFVQINAILMVLGNRRLNRNLIHGLLLQLVKILEVRPDNISLEESLRDDIVKNCENCLWLLQETLLIKPCYITANTYVMILHHLLWRFPEICEHGKDIFEQASETLELLFSSSKTALPENNIVFGRENFIRNAFHLHFILLNKYGNVGNITKVILNNMNHGHHDLDLIILDILAEFQMRIVPVRNVDSINLDTHLHKCFSLENIASILSSLNRSNDLLLKLIHVFKTTPVSECKQKSLILLSYYTDSYKELFQMHDMQNLSTGQILKDIIAHVNDIQEYNGHIYVTMLNNYLRRADVKETLMDPSESRLFLDTTVAIMNSSSCEKSFEKRVNAVELLKENILFLLQRDYENHSVKGISNILLWATLATFLEDDEEEIRCIASDIIIVLHKNFHQGSDSEASFEHVIPSRARELLLECVLFCQHKDCKDAVEINAMLLVLALFEFNSEIVSENLIGNIVPGAADKDDEPEIRVFDKGEMNIFLEEYIWTNDSMEKLLPAFKSCHNLNELAISLLHILLDESYSLIFSELCGDNYEAFVENLISMSSSHEKYAALFNELAQRSSTVSNCHPKVKTAIMKIKSIFL